MRTAPCETMILDPGESKGPSHNCVVVPMGEPSVLQGVAQTGQYYMGELPARPGDETIRDLGGLHGFTGCAATLSDLALGLASEGYRAVALDLVGHGRSDAPPDPASSLISNTFGPRIPAGRRKGLPPGASFVIAARSLRGIRSTM